MAVREVWGLNHPSWLAAQVGQESGWRDGLTSRVGAKGMCQFMPATAAGMERNHPDLARMSRFSPSWCFRAQALLMKELYNTYNNVRDPCNSIKFAGSAYNGGPGMLNREIGICHAWRLGECHYEHWDDHVSQMNARAGWAWKENRDYVYRITVRASAYTAEGWGMDFCAPAPPIDAPSPIAPQPLSTPPP